MDFDPRPVVAELLCTKSLANEPHCGYTLRLKWNLDPADPTENRNLENWLMVLFRAKGPRFLLCWGLMLIWAIAVGLEKRTVLCSFGKVECLQSYFKTYGWIYRILEFQHGSLVTITADSQLSDPSLIPPTSLLATLPLHMAKLVSKPIGCGGHGVVLCKLLRLKIEARGEQLFI